MKWFTKNYLLDALKAEGLPSSYKFLLKMERLGIVPLSQSSVDVSVSNRMRLYSDEEVREIVKKIRAYKMK